MNTSDMKGQQFAILLPKRVKVITHLVSTLLPGFLFAILTVLVINDSGIPTAWFILEILLITIYYGGFVALYYWLAGGFEWKPNKLPLIRVVLFWFFGVFILSFIQYVLWYLIRKVISKREKIPITSMLGRLLATHGRTDYQEYLPPAKGVSSKPEVVCEKCETKTALGSYYTFVHGKKAGTTTRYVSSTLRVHTTTYTEVSKSSPAYLCNKCVYLYGPRRTSARFKKGLIISATLLVIAIPIDIFSKSTTISVLPAMALILGGSAAFFQYVSREYKENAPIEAFADMKHSPVAILPASEQNDSYYTNNGERLAIQLRKPSLINTGVDSFFTHEEAKKLHKEPH